MSKAHAKHNEDVCDFLITDGKFTDWIVTTSFYSALHYVQHEIFPLTENGTVYPNFNNYYNSVLKIRRISKHEGTKQLVRIYIPECFSHYRWLLDSCMNARYSNYRISSAKANLARINLDEIKKHLKK
jgi:hypothetical protein